MSARIGPTIKRLALGLRFAVVARVQLAEAPSCFRRDGDC